MVSYYFISNSRNIESNTFLQDCSFILGLYSLLNIPVVVVVYNITRIMNLILSEKI